MDYGLTTIDIAQISYCIRSNKKTWYCFFMSAEQTLIQEVAKGFTSGRTLIAQANIKFYP
jgi:hypothetical protein